MNLPNFFPSTQSRVFRHPRVAPTAAALTLTVALLAGCSSAADSQSDPTSSTPTNVSQSQELELQSAQATTSSGTPMTVDEAMEVNHSYWTFKGDISKEATPITLTGNSATSTSSSVTVNGSTVTITAGGTYKVTGSLAGQLVVDVPDEDEVRLILADANITNTTGPAVLLNNADGVLLELAANTCNTVSDTATVEEGADENAALFSHVDLQISGEGTLLINGGGEDGIASKDDLVITAGTIKVVATDDGLRGKDAVVITGGDVQITAGGDGLKTTNEEETDRGYFLITGGDLTIAAGSDGIDSAQDALFDGGNVLITQSEEGVEAQNLLIGAGTLDITSSDDGLNATWGSTSAETGTETGTDAGPTAGTGPGAGGPMGDVDDGSNLVIYGGTVTIDAEGDGVDSNGSLTISGGTVTIFGTSTGGNGAFDANGTFTLSGGDVLAISAGQMEQGPSEVSQALVEATASGTSGTTVTVSAKGAVLREVAAAKNFGYVLYSSPQLSEGDLVNIATGGTSVEVSAAMESSSAGMGPGGMGGRGGPDLPGGGDLPEGRPEEMGGMEPPSGPEAPAGT